MVSERTRDGARQPNGRPSEGEGDGKLVSVRLAGESLLAAGADAIQKALSGDSESFLAATRQQGGQ